MFYSQKLKDPRWQRRRLEILTRDGFTCQYCFDTTTELHVHHKEYNGHPWEALDEDLVTLCKHCHFVCEAVKDFSGSAEVYIIRKTQLETCIQLIAFANDETCRWVIFYSFQDDELSYTHAISDNIVKHLYETLYPKKKK